MIDTLKHLADEISGWSGPVPPQIVNGWSAELRALLAASSCVWAPSPDYEMWETSCGRAWTFIDGTPEDNGMAYCCYCGKNLEEMKS